MKLENPIQTAPGVFQQETLEGRLIIDLNKGQVTLGESTPYAIHDRSNPIEYDEDFCHLIISLQGLPAWMPIPEGMAAAINELDRSESIKNASTLENLERRKREFEAEFQKMVDRKNELAEAERLLNQEKKDLLKGLRENQKRINRLKNESPKENSIFRGTIQVEHPRYIGEATASGDLDRQLVLQPTQEGHYVIDLRNYSISITDFKNKQKQYSLSRGEDRSCVAKDSEEDGGLHGLWIWTWGEVCFIPIPKKLYELIRTIERNPK